MFRKKEAYLCLSAMLRAREAKLLTAEHAGRMIDASTFEEAAKSLTDLGYEDMSGMKAKEIDAALNRRRDEIFAEIGRLSPDKEIPDTFRIRYDYHNAKVLIKSEAAGSKAEYLLSGAGRVSPETLERQYVEEMYRYMPGNLGEAMKEAKSVLARTSNPQLADFILDNAYYAELKQLSGESGNDFFIGYVRLLIDTANLKSAVRTFRMKRNSEFLKDVIVSGGNVSEKEILACEDREKVIALFSRAGLEKAAELGAEAAEGGKLTMFELECDNAVNRYIRRAKVMNYGSEPVMAYLASVENEITAVRMILTGKLSGIRSGMLKERLRDLYA